MNGCAFESRSRLWRLRGQVTLTRVSHGPFPASEDVMRWFTNMLPEEKRLYIGATTVLVFVIAAFIATSQM